MKQIGIATNFGRLVFRFPGWFAPLVQLFARRELASGKDLMTYRLRSSRAGLTLFCLTVLVALHATSVPAQTGWTTIAPLLARKDLNAVFFADSKRGWIGGDGGFVSRTDDGGGSWVQQRVGTVDPINDIYFRNKDEGFLLSGARIFNTSDGGLTWVEGHAFSSSDFGGAQPELYSVRFTGRKKGWVVGSLSRASKNGEQLVVDALIYHTSDGGETWNRQSSPTHGELIHLDIVSDKRGWVVGSRGTVLYTEDGGETWNLQQSHTNVTLYHVDFRNDKRGCAVGEKATILRTEDGGQNWTSSFTGLRSTLLSVFFINDNEGWAVGRGGVILRTFDRGISWVAQRAGTTKNLYALFFNKKYGWAVGADGVILRYSM
jgi:photosystem II stability/assembly factor-like uncharacterized protein